MGFLEDVTNLEYNFLALGVNTACRVCSPTCKLGAYIRLSAIDKKIYNFFKLYYASQKICNK